MRKPQVTIDNPLVPLLFLSCLGSLHCSPKQGSAWPLGGTRPWPAATKTPLVHPQRATARPWSTPKAYVVSGPIPTAAGKKAYPAATPSPLEKSSATRPQNSEGRRNTSAAKPRTAPASISKANKAKEAPLAADLDKRENLLKLQRQLSRQNKQATAEGVGTKFQSFRRAMAKRIVQIAAEATFREASLARSVERQRLVTITELQRQGFRIGPSQTTTGAVRTFSLHRYHAAPRWLMLKLELRFPCGTDQSTFLFRIENKRTQPLAEATATRGLRREDLGTWLRMSEGKTKPRLATLGRLRRCRSNKALLQVNLLEYDKKQHRFSTRLESEAELAPHSTPRLWLHANRLQIHYSGKTSSWRSHDHRQVRLNYSLNEPMVRIAPFASSPSDAVEDWLEGSIATAEALCQPDRRKALMPWRKRLAAIRRARQEVMLRPFDVGKNQFDVGVACWGCKPAQAYFVRLRFDGRRYFLLNVRQATSDDLDIIVHGPEALKAFGHKKRKVAP